MMGVRQRISRAGSGGMLMIPLSEFKEGERGLIVGVKGRGNFRKRLQEMGFIKGAEVLVEKYAPLRDPMELVLKGYHVSLRVEEAAQIMMEQFGE
jgi:Fe2+ transport system protein FeoA